MRLLAVASVTVGMILYPLQFSMIQMLEGYWGASPLAVYVRLLATRRYDRRRASWDDKQQSDADTKSAVSKKTQLGALGRVRRSETENRRARAIYVDALYSLPKPDRMMPTRLGNVLRSAEDAAGERYALKTILVMPLLFPQLPPSIADRLAGSRLQFDTSVRFCLVWLIATIVSLLMLFRFDVWLCVPVATYVLSWLSYRAACAAAGGYGVMLRVAIDLHRFDLMNALHLPLPADHGEELARNEALMNIVSGTEIMSGRKRSALHKFSYSHPSTDPNVQDQASNVAPSGPT